MILPVYFTNKVNCKYSKTIKIIVNSDFNDSSMVSKYGYGLLDLAISLNARRPKGLMQFSEYRDAILFNKSVKKFIKMYLNKNK